MIKDRIYLNTYLKISDYYYVRKMIRGKLVFHRDKRALKFPTKDLDLFLSYRETQGGIKLYFVAEGGTGLRITKYNLKKSKVIKKAREVVEQRNLSQFLIAINKQCYDYVSPRYCKIIKRAKDVAAD